MIEKSEEGRVSNPPPTDREKQPVRQNAYAVPHPARTVALRRKRKALKGRDWVLNSRNVLWGKWDRSKRSHGHKEETGGGGCLEIRKTRTNTGNWGGADPSHDKT